MTVSEYETLVYWSLRFLLANLARRQHSTVPHPDSPVRTIEFEMQRRKLLAMLRLDVTTELPGPPPTDAEGEAALRHLELLIAKDSEETTAWAEQNLTPVTNYFCEHPGWEAEGYTPPFDANSLDPEAVTQLQESWKATWDLAKEHRWLKTWLRVRSRFGDPEFPADV